jgi:hypothetical protein
MVRFTRCSSSWDVSGIAHLLRPYRLNPLTPIGFVAYHSILYSVPHRSDSHEARGPEWVVPTSVIFGWDAPAQSQASLPSHMWGTAGTGSLLAASANDKWLGTSHLSPITMTHWL